jgi:uncharacterized protein YaaQ
MGLFTSKQKIKDPLAAQKKTAANYLINLLNQGTPDIPQQQVAGMTGVQSDLLSSLGDYTNDINANYGQATGYYKDVLSGNYDPRNSDYYKGLRNEAAQLKADSGTAIKRNASAGGMLSSSPTSALIGSNERQINNQLLTLLGGMYENERSRMGQAAQGLQQADSQRIQNVGQTMQVADVERQIEQQRNNALYNQALQTVMFPYQYQVNIASAIFGASQPIVTGGGATDLGIAFSALTGAAGSIVGGMAAGGTGFFK